MPPEDEALSDEPDRHDHEQEPEMVPPGQCRQVGRITGRPRKRADFAAALLCSCWVDREIAGSFAAILFTSVVPPPPRSRLPTLSGRELRRTLRVAVPSPR